jgi:hypothetical protein
MENPEGGKAQESYASDYGLNNLVGKRILVRRKSPEDVETSRGKGRRKRRTAAWEEEGFEGRAQERIRHERRPAGLRRMKASRGWENLKTLVVGK